MEKKFFYWCKNHSYEAALLLIMSGTFLFLKCAEKDWKTLLKEENAFISDSFVETCNGNGFSSFEEWQKVCREKYHLDYIAWCPAADFIVDESGGESGTLYFGRWHGKNGYGEVYARKKD